MRLGLLPSELARKISIAEYTELVAFNSISTWGPEREDWRAAITAAACNAGFSGEFDPERFLFSNVVTFDPPETATEKTDAEIQQQHREALEAMALMFKQ